MAMKCYANGYTARFFANKGYLILHLEHTLFFSLGKKSHLYHLKIPKKFIYSIQDTYYIPVI